MIAGVSSKAAAFLHRSVSFYLVSVLRVICKLKGTREGERGGEGGREGEMREKERGREGEEKGKGEETDR